MDRSDGRFVILLAQPNSQPEPPIAQAPKPTGVMDKSELPRRFVFISGLDCAFVFSVLIDQNLSQFTDFPMLLVTTSRCFIVIDVVQLAVGCITPRDWIVSGDKLPVTFR